jgi:hypothetical protein
VARANSRGFFLMDLLPGEATDDSDDGGERLVADDVGDGLA